MKIFDLKTLKIVTVIFCLITLGSCNAKTEEKKQNGDGSDSSIDIQEISSKTENFVATTNDYLEWNGLSFSLSKTPLSCFKNYKELYQFEGTVLESYLYYYGPDDKPYTCIWMINNDTLYLRNVALNRLSYEDEQKLFPGNKKMRMMEDFTNQKTNEKGLIPAKWFTDTLEIRDVEKRRHFYRFIFKQGKLIEGIYIKAI